MFSIIILNAKISTKLCYKSLKLDPRMLYPAKSSFKSNMKISTDFLMHERKHTP